MATTRVTMPQLGESVHEGTISKWLVKPGDRVVEYEPMLEVDTDKVNAEVPAPVTGVLKEILANEGDTVQAGSEIAVVEVEGEAEAPERVELRAEEATPTEAGAGAGAGGSGDAMPSAEQAEKADTEPRPAPGGAREGATSEQPAAEQAAGQEAAVAEERRQEPEPDGGPQAPDNGSGAGHRYSPAVLMLAEEQGVDLSRIQGSGLGGRITKRDVRQFVESQRQPPHEPAPAAQQAPEQAAAAPSAPTAASSAPGSAPAAGDEAVPLSRMRRLIAENMTRSKTTIPHAWQTQEVDMSGVAAHRNANKAAFQQREGFSLTYLPYVLAAAASALREHPEANATFNETEIIVHRAINLGVSVGFEDTLLVPVIKNADGLSLAGLARAVNDLAGRARSRQLKADELQGGTFTVNNSGTFGTLFSYSVINPGQAGILTMEAIVERPVAVNGMIGIKPMMYLCFSFDHRLLDGLQGARFLTTARKWLEAVNPDTSL
jgi:2-oxoisovalerate dehydrogenase E2 component (dihydrolipoyl transacylase)